MKFREIRYNEKKQSILESASRIFAKKGYEKTTLEEIAAELKMTKGSLYYYIKSKEELLFQCQMQGLDEAIKVLSDILNSDMAPEIKMVKAIMAHIKVITKDYVVGALQQQHLNLPDNLMQKLIKERDRFQRIFSDILEEGIKKKAFGKNDCKMKAFAILGAINWIPKWYSPDGDLTSEEIGKAMATFFVKGLIAHG